MWFKKRTYMEWDDYKNHIEFLDMFHFQQSVRKSNVENL